MSLSHGAVRQESFAELSRFRSAFRLLPDKR